MVNCTYGDVAATRTIALAGGSHAEHWLPALDLLGPPAPLQSGDVSQNGLPVVHRGSPADHGQQRPYPQCREWVQRTMAKLVADRPDYVFTTSTRPWNIKTGDVMPATYIGIWQTLSDNNIPILAMRDTPWLVKNGQPFDPADCLAKGGNAQSCAIKRSDALADRNPDPRLRRAVPAAQGARHVGRAVMPTRLGENSNLGAVLLRPES